MKKQVISRIIVLSITLFGVYSCQKETVNPIPQSNISASLNSEKLKKKITVSTMDELYSAVNNPDNAGTTIIIAPGNYVLNASYPNAGRLELQEDMSLRGQPGQIDDVIIDESSLPTNSFRLSPTVSTGGIRVGKGTNSIEWLTIKGGALAANPFSMVETDLVAASMQLNISHVNFDCNGTRTGLMIRNRLDEHINREINVTVEHCEIWGATNTIGFGIAIQNRSTGGQVKLDMRENYIHGNKIALLCWNGGLNNSIENCRIEINSYADRLEGNGCAMDPSAATNGSAATTANQNSILIKMIGTSIKDNNPAEHPELIPTNGALPGGIFAVAAYNSLNNINAFQRVSNNNASLEFIACRFENNNGPDIYAYAAWSPPNAILAGIYNQLNIILRGISSQAMVEGYASIPSEPAGTNILTVTRN